MGIHLTDTGYIRDNNSRHASVTFIPIHAIEVLIPKCPRAIPMVGICHKPKKRNSQHTKERSLTKKSKLTLRTQGNTLACRL